MNWGYKTELKDKGVTYINGYAEIYYLRRNIPPVMTILVQCPTVQYFSIILSYSYGSFIDANTIRTLNKKNAESIITGTNIVLATGGTAPEQGGGGMGGGGADNIHLPPPPIE